MNLPPDYNKIFKNNLVVITGVARSGTTLLGKIIGSLSDTHFIFEPPTFRLIPPLIKETKILHVLWPHVMHRLL